MVQTANSELLKGDEPSAPTGPLVFLDTNVIVNFLHGDPAAAQLFRAEAEGHLRFAINDIVLQELILGGEATRQGYSNALEHVTILPLEWAKAQPMIPLARTLLKGDHPIHSNDILILSSAGECDYLATDDERRKGFASTFGIHSVVTPKELTEQLRAA